MLCSARVNPNMSAYTYLFGEFDLNATPLAPPGIRVVSHTNSKVRGTWQPNGNITGVSIVTSLILLQLVMSITSHFPVNYTFPKSKNRRLPTPGCYRYHLNLTATSTTNNTFTTSRRPFSQRSSPAC